MSAIPESNDKTPVSIRLSRSNSLSTTSIDKPPHHLAPRPVLKLDTESRSTAPLVPKRSPPRSVSPLVPLRPERSDSLDTGRSSPLLRTPPNAGRTNTLRITELYDDYYKDPTAYDDDIPSLPPIGEKKRELEAWAKKTPLGRSPSNASRALPPSSFGWRGLARAPSRSGSMMDASRASRYEDEENMDMVKIRVKVGQPSSQANNRFMRGNTPEACLSFPTKHMKTSSPL